ncbi:hypothetical protein CQ10_09615 [Bradyrhizobium valentinum]|uniref:Uncharacterized protein n=1 Tax=Bradyrhizobium valentinum TaxID=1518501 RepID=A0A0R3M1U8_9BRAD|nr:hypothetical protein CP49_04030 [Bradyrhizobium valentinum]KRR14058.1 hypothetical protein CQ10_09615 [Bradyrhizobium valentinum]
MEKLIDLLCGCRLPEAAFGFSAVYEFTKPLNKIRRSIQQALRLFAATQLHFNSRNGPRGDEIFDR